VHTSVRKARNTADFVEITSFQGRRLDELYYDPDNATHKYRRKWYLPIAPTPNHPDAISKLTRKRFPTLVLGRGATLRTNSYVNIRHIYRIRHSLLQTYTNPVTPDVEQYRLKGESKIRMIAKCKTLTNYEPTRQFGSLPKPKSEPSAVSMSVSRPASTDVDEGEEEDYEEDDNGDDEDDDADARPLVVCAMASLDITTNTMTTARESTATSDRAQADFRLLNTGTERKADVRPKIPPDIERTRGRWVPQDVSVRQVGQFLGEVESLAILAHQRLVTMSYDPTVIRRPLDRAWRDFKGVTAVAIASM
jgi:hypothetical protein